MADSVLVVDVLAAYKWSSEYPFHDKAVLEDVAAFWVVLTNIAQSV